MDYSYKKAKIYKIANLIFYILTVLVNVLANAIPINGKTTGEIAASYPNLFTPAPFTFAIWGVIYVSLGLFIVYQLGIFSKHNDKHLRTVSRIGCLFVISCIANIFWILSWHYELISLSLVIMITLLTSLIMIYIRINQNRLSITKEKIFVNIPFSIYLAWITIATIANVTVFLVSINWNGFGIPPQIWTIGVLILALIITLDFLLKKKDVFYSLVVEWALFGILAKHLTFYNGEYIGIIITTIILMILIFIGIIVVLRKN